MTMITEILGDLYKVSFRIRNSSTRPRPLKSSLYKDIDEETGVDKFEIYAKFDRRHIEECFIQLRKEAAEKLNMDPSEAAKIPEEDKFLIKRLAATLTEHRKVFRYWQRHAKKLATGPEGVQKLGPFQSFPVAVPNDTEQTPEAQRLIQGPQRVQIAPASSVTVKTILSGTVATEYNRSLDDDTQSVISYASTSYDVNGDVVDLPFPPATAFKQTEFLCPYCGIVYPSRLAQPRAWKAHVLQDLQPYVCTYPDCSDELHMYSTRHAWLEHERLVHRRVWQCFGHETAVFGSQSDLYCHLKSQHNDDVTEAQVQDLLDVSESSLADARENCPVCLIGRQFFKELDKHMSFHLEKFAIFSVSRGIPTDDEEDSSGADGQSGKAQGLGSVDSTPSGSLYFESPAQSVADPSDDNNKARLKKREELEVQSLEKRKREFGEEHPDTLSSMANLALTYKDQRRWKEAENLQIQVMETSERVLGEQHPFTLMSVSNLASVLQDQGKYEEAEEMYRRALTVKEEVLGEKHLDTLKSLSNLVFALQMQGKEEEAEEICRRVLTVKEEVLGKEHPDTLKSLSNLALALQMQSKYEEAEEIYRRALTVKEEVLGEEHLDTLKSVSNLALVLQDQIKYKEAEKMYRRVLIGLEKEFGIEHSKTLMSLRNLASVLRDQGKYEEAEEIYQRALIGLEKVLGKEHPDTLMNIKNLALVLQIQGKYEEAEKMYRLALIGLEKVLGKEHPDTLISIRSLASVLQEQRKYEEAEEIYRRARIEREKMRETEHENVENI